MVGGDVMKFQHVGLSFFLLAFCAAPLALARQKTEYVSGGATRQLYQLLDDSYGGKLSDFYVLADQYTDAKNPDSRLQHVLSVAYDKNLYFGRLVIEVRSIAKPTLDQLKTYTPKQMFNFGESDSQKFEKITPGPLGTEGDLYLSAQDDDPLTSSPVTDEVREEYDHYIARYILPALQKNK
jgi:hypothetical protein